MPPRRKPFTRSTYKAAATRKDVSDAIVELMPLAAADDPEATFTVANLFFASGNAGAGRVWLERSAAAGNPQAVRTLAGMNRRASR